MEKQEFAPALAWIFLSAPNSPVDCYLRFSTGEQRLLFQKKGTATRKNLIQNLMKIGVYEFDIPDSQYRFYLDLVEQSIESSFCIGKISQFRMQNQLQHLLLPLKARLPYALQQMLKEIALDTDEARRKFTLPNHPGDFDLIQTLFTDIDLAASSLDKEAENKDKFEIETLKKKVIAQASEIDQLKQMLHDTETELSKSELEAKQAIDAQYVIQGEFNKLKDEFDDISRKYNITKGEIEGLLSGHQDAKQIYANRVASLEKRMEEIRAESQDFKLKYAKEIDKNKELQRSLSQAQTNLTRTATALKKFTEKK
ncbi:MAG: hypothetical protein BroJett040_22340 [Oligoflexia bacterium]|nr:MAG: hypothetical protein BroJett040_22340 [Oligoflexia bacterium]